MAEATKENTTVVETVVEKFTQLPESGKAYVLGYLLGKEAERRNAEQKPA